jgi:hypothetical protein
MLFTMINFNPGQKIKKETRQPKSNLDAHLNRNFISLDKHDEVMQRTDKRPTKDSLLMCRALKADKVREYLESLEKEPKKKIVRIFLGIIYSKSAGLPILCDKEMPSVKIAGISFGPLQNVQARILTKITLLILIESESQKLDIWNHLQQVWTEKYIIETKMYVRILEAVAKQCENSGQKDKAMELFNSIKLIKEANMQYAIDW